MVKKKDEIPEWVSEDIKNAKFGSPAGQKQAGYILELYYADNKMDVQLYEPVEDGRHIVTMDLLEGTGDLEKGVVYEFVFNQYKAPLNSKVSEYLKEEKEIDMTAIYRFELKSVERLDVSSEAAEE